jgi:hypothetical protein
MPDVKTDNAEERYRWADQIPAPLWDDLALRSPQEAADCVGAILRDELFEVPLLGTVYRIDPKQRRIVKIGQSGHRVSYQTGIVLLTTLAKSMGVPPSGRMVTPEELQGGRLFFTGAHRVPTRALVKRYGGQPQALVEWAIQLGAENIPGADHAVCLPGLPRLPLYILFWDGDESLESRAIIGIDDRALFHLDLAGVFGLLNILVERMVAET